MQLLQWIRTHPKFAQLPFVMLSSSPRETDISNAYAAGANAYFVKPRTLTGFMQLLGELRPYWSAEKEK
jgi:CheY-like chemotaxis protein